jgi:flagellar assembly factor FliW
MVPTMLSEQKKQEGHGLPEVITFSSGLLGFESLTRFTLIDDEAIHPYRILQAVDDSWVGFTVIDPHLFLTDYSFTVTEADRAALELEDGEGMMVLAIVVVSEDPVEVTANLLAPLVINLRAGLGRQIVLQSSTYSVRHHILG